MKLTALASLLLSLALLGNFPAAFAMETDQYNLPPTPLFDIGDEVSDHIAENLFRAVAQINAEIDTHQACFSVPRPKGSKCGTVEAERSRLDYLRSNDAVAYEVFKLLGNGSLVLTVTGKWFIKHRFSHEPARYKTSYGESIYLVQPIDYLTMSPTIKVFGTEFGVDKVEHFFQQGYDYYKVYQKERAAGETPETASQKAVKWGKITENTYFGLLVSGVFSNADLVANYAGMRFYQGMTSPVQIGESTRPPILSLSDGSWIVNEPQKLRENLFKPFVSDHLNEALNPSIYAFNIYPYVRKLVKKQSCPQWKKMYPALTKADFESKSTNLNLWNGEDYGHQQKSMMVSLADACFAN